MGVLEEIVAHVRAVVEERKRALPEAELRSLAAIAPARPSLAVALRGAGRKPRVIAELKRASPSRGPIAPGADAVALARDYLAAGASALSVLTEERWFAGSLDDLAAVARAVPAPILRKDFTVDPYQVWEARACGASAVLLIARLHPAPALRALREAAAEAGLDALVEVHDERDLDRALEAGASLIGVNNRDLDTLAVSLAVSERLAARIPAASIRVSESGIRTPDDVARLGAMGYDALLVGEALMAAAHPGAALRALMGRTATGGE